MKTIFHGRGGKISLAEVLPPNSHQKQKSLPRGAKENVDPEFPLSSLELSSVPKPPLPPKIRSPLHPRPSPNPSDTPLKKKKLCLETFAENGSESGVQVSFISVKNELDKLIGLGK